MHNASICLFEAATTVTTVTLQDGFASLDSYVSQTLDWTGLDITSVTMCMRFQMFQMRGLLDGSLWSGSVREHVENNFFVANKINLVQNNALCKIVFFAHSGIDRNPIDPLSGFPTFDLNLGKQGNQGGPMVFTPLGEMPFAKWWHLCATVNETEKVGTGTKSNLTAWLNGVVETSGVV